MPLHAIESLPGHVTLGLWHLTEAPASLWPQLAGAAAYAPLLPARAAGPRQAQWLAGRVLVQHLAAAAAPGSAWVLGNEPSGRPFLAGPGPAPAVSLSHAGAWVAALLAPPGTALGIDVEAVRPKAQRVAAKYLNSQELHASVQLAAATAAFPSSAAELYSLLWSAKETLYKLASRPGILFREHLLLDLPPGPWPVAGALPARLAGGGCNSRHQICYLQPAAGYVLTYCY